MEAVVEQVTKDTPVPEGMAKLWCNNGEHYWLRPAQRGRKPYHCPDHLPEPDAPREPVQRAQNGYTEADARAVGLDDRARYEANQTVTLWCALGQHEWERPRQRGKKPLNCPEHQPVKESTGQHGASEGQRDATKDAIWAKIERLVDETNCHCVPELRRGMTLEDLRNVKNCKPNFICTALDSYRRSVS